MIQHSKFSEAAADLYESNQAIMKLVSERFEISVRDLLTKEVTHA